MSMHVTPVAPFVGMATPRLWLRHFAPTDLPVLLAYHNDPTVLHFQGWAPWDEATAAGVIAASVHDQPGTPGSWFQFAIELQASGACVGDVGLYTNAEHARLGQVGYTIAPAHQGNGYATEAVGAVIDYAFRTLQLHRLTATLDMTNRASAALLERLGFRREAAMIQNSWYNGAWCDEYLYAILSHEWVARHPAPLFRAGSPLRTQTGAAPDDQQGR